MRTLISNLIILAAITFSTLSLNAADVEIRFAKSEYIADNKELIVEVQVRNASVQDIKLAGQNYRFYYDSEILDLNTDNSSSLLPQDSYTPITFETSVKGIRADKVNQVTFDDDLGFANFSIDLHDLKNGGKVLAQDEWVTVANLSFDVKKESKAYDLVWGRQGATDLYATAFVEITEWISAKKIDNVGILYYGDLSSQEETKKEIVFDAKIGPNPTSDFVNVTLDQALDSEAQVNVRDITGKVVSAATLSAGQQSTTLDLSTVAPATYIVEIADVQSNTINKARIIVAR